MTTLDLIIKYPWVYLLNLFCTFLYFPDKFYFLGRNWYKYRNKKCNEFLAKHKQYSEEYGKDLNLWMETKDLAETYGYAYRLIFIYMLIIKLFF